MATADPASFLKQPLSPPPTGVTSNFAHPESRASVIYIAAGICLTFILVFTALRFYAKITIMKEVKWDDATCLLGLLGATSYITIVVATVSGSAYGIYGWDIIIADFTKKQLVLALISECIYSPCIWFIKLALFVLYLEVFGLLRWLRYLVITGATVTGAFYTASFVSFIVLCSPKNGQSRLSYLSALSGPQCTQIGHLSITLRVVNVISDLYLILIPLPAVWSLQLPLRRKISLSGMFLTGSIACIASILGLSYRVREIRSTDNTWTAINVLLTTIVEMTAGIIVCCMPTTAAVFRKLQPPLSSFLASYGRVLRSPFSSSPTIHHEQISSSVNLRSSIYGDNNHQRDYKIFGGVQKTLSGTENSRTKRQQEFDTSSAFPLENTKIRKTTEIDVAQHSRRY